MLERFKVPDDIAVRVDQAVMRQAVEDIFKTFDMPEEEAEASADVLIYADVRGIDSHGVSNMMRAYVAGFRAEQINPAPSARRERETLGRFHTIATTDWELRKVGLLWKKPANGQKKPALQLSQRTTVSITARQLTTRTRR